MSPRGKSLLDSRLCALLSGENVCNYQDMQCFLLDAVEPANGRLNRKRSGEIPTNVVRHTGEGRYPSRILGISRWTPFYNGVTEAFV